ncbi:MAG TPA: methyl-accepting chemotaxis protein [Leptospiraceae bacterium]|nr:methyl-accepting chemotaxis protein [Leptospiraceae bacterium]HMY66099.1 methyl-accepting chemotaxis protein [Leptospiraceae bacterium]HNF26043.1 methyl-accepting chemotaxis protein [Leptospiraceae bacterium]HNH07034.1 methyl-accepting chemotaxis protein [Leptospiraceae bacterium]HNI96930.1 methyl-accepting chemotaxis protein [Leptospiraceae bacterium]
MNYTDLIHYKKWKLNFKIASAFYFIGSVSLLIVGITSYMISRAAMQEETFRRVTLVREAKASQIEDYFSIIRSQTQTYSENRSVIDAMREFKTGYNSIERESVSEGRLASAKERVRKYYEKELMTRLKAGSADANLPSLLPRTNTEYILQDLYISSNSNEVGKKNLLNAAKENYSYNAVHAKYHQTFMNYQQKFGFYDMFLVDVETGNILYTVFKELDFSTSLLDGPYSSSNIGKVFKEVKNANQKGYVKLIDFEPYIPSYGAAGAFIGTPIFDKEQMIGVLIFQLPLDKIMEIMNFHNSWKEAGMGKSGETFLIGQDLKMKSLSRFLIETPEEYYKTLDNSDLPPETVQKIKTLKTNIGLQENKTKAGLDIAKGITGEAVYDDYRKVRVIASYKPLKIEDVKWGIISKIDEDEAFSEVVKLRNNLFIIAFFVFILIGLITFSLSRLIIKPITAVVERVKDIGSGEGDLTKRLTIESNDELGELANWFNKFLVKIHSIVLEISSTSQIILASSNKLSETSLSLSASTEETSAQSELIASASTEMSQSVQIIASSIEEMSISISEVARRASDYAAISKEANQAAIETNIIVNKLGDDAKEIGKVIESIADIASQTHLLSLNAAIEAASAGDAGKGFAVVASEVKELAKQSAISSQEIKEKIFSIQKNTESTITAINRIVTTISKVNDISSTIASAVEEQSITSKEISSNISQTSIGAREVTKNILGINKAARSGAQRAAQTSELAEELQELTAGLEKIVKSFKI